MTDDAYTNLKPGDSVVVTAHIGLMDRDWGAGTVVNVVVVQEGSHWFFHNAEDPVPMWLTADEICSMDEWAAHILTT